MITYEKAKKEVEKLLNYIELIESFKIQSLKDLIIYQYAMYNSISKVIKIINKNNMDIDFDNNIVTHEYVKQTILSDPNNELHTLIRKQYKIKTRPQKRIR